ncbi:MAG: 16S rRNA (cytosine(1402)-N(4))-methyltransferase RsmH [Pseudomonadota bacterium]
MTDERYHQPVLLREIVEHFAPLGGVVVDATVGGAGHAAALLEENPELFLVGVDQDPDALVAAAARLKRFEGRYKLIRSNFSEIPEILREIGWGEVRGVYADLGVSSHQLDTGDRGFSIRHEGPLDMRMDPDGTSETAASVIDNNSVRELADILYYNGEIRASIRMAKSLKTARRRGLLTNTRELAEICAATLPRKGRIHPATLVFQALRIAVNDELGALDRLLKFGADVVAPGGLLGVISFHSLEDRKVKHAFRDGRRDGNWEILTPRPLLPDAREEHENPRSRSAKLRIARRTS